MTAQLVFAIVCHLALALTMATLALGSMSLPDGIENILGFVPVSNFRCERDGYFGDIDNDCRIFHLCQKQLSPGGKVEWRHWTYACGNQTMFNQLTLTCAFVDEAIPCRHASQFQYLNEVIHKPREPFLTDADVTSGISYYTNRVMSDGARNRAFEDSNLMAQLGGQSAAAAATNSFVSTTNQQFAEQNSNVNLNFLQPSFFQDQFQAQSQPAADTDDSSSRTINSIELPPQPSPEQQQQQQQPLIATFQSLSRQATAQSDGDARQASDRRQDLVLINHSSNQQQQQQQQQQQLPQLQFFAFPQEQRFNPPPAAAAPTTLASVQQQQQAQVTTTTPSAAGESVALAGPAASFNFAVSTDHQLGSSSSFTVNSHLNNNNFQLPAAANQVPTTTTTTTSTTATASSPQVPSQATTAQPTTVSFSAEPQTTPVAAATSTSPPPDPTTSTTTTSTLAPSTTTLATISAAPRAGFGFGSGSSQQRQARARAQQRTRNGARGDSSGHLPIDAHPMRHFQSNRLSSMKQPASSSESAVVMRRQPAPVSPVSPVLPVAPVVSPQQVSEEQTGGFWRRPFDVPRFESLLTRRRV